MKDLLKKTMIPWTLIVGCLILLGLGFDGEVRAILAMAAMWAFKDTRGAIKEAKK